MCQTCKGEGIVLDEQTFGVFFKPCYCEAAQKKQAQAKQELQEMLGMMRSHQRETA